MNDGVEGPAIAAPSADGDVPPIPKNKVQAALQRLGAAQEEASQRARERNRLYDQLRELDHELAITASRGPESVEAVRAKIAEVKQELREMEPKVQEARERYVLAYRNWHQLSQAEIEETSKQFGRPRQKPTEIRR